MVGIAFVFTLLSTSGFAELTCNFHAFSDEEQAKFESVVVEGFYSHGFEKQAFLPLDSKKPWWVTSSKLSELLIASNASRLRVVVRGMLSPIGKYGHLLEYERCLTQVEVLKVIDPANIPNNQYGASGEMR